MTGRLALTLCVLLLAAGACGQVGSTPGATVPASTRPSSLVVDENGVLLTFDGADVLSPTTLVRGVRVRKLGDARVETVTAGDGSRALALPAYRDGDDEQRLVLLLAGDGATAGSRSDSVLSFGADVRLEAGRTSGVRDNGDNIVQRGLYADDDQYKLQVDHRVPSCSIRTPRGRSVLTTEVALDDGWWRLSCDYDGVSLRARVSPLDGRGDARDLSQPARLGALSFSPGTPISVGGKVTDDGRLVVNQPDQLNGALDNVTVSPAP